MTSGGSVVDESILRNTSITSRTYAMRHNWLTQVERQYVQTLLDEAIQHVKYNNTTCQNEGYEVMCSVCSECNAVATYVDIDAEPGRN